SEVVNYSLIFSRVNNAISINIYAVLEFLLLTVMFGKALNRIFPFRVFQVVIVLFLALVAVDWMLWTPAGALNTVAQNSANILLIVWPILWFIQALRTGTMQRFSRQPMFYASMGCLVYFGASTPLWAIFDQLSPEKAAESAIAFMFANWALKLLQYILFGIALWTPTPTSASPPSSGSAPAPPSYW
ncbi:MAG: hypothetical protein AAF570_03410, partial [Bacteroidota bacterium]